MTREEAETWMFGLKNYQWLQHPLLYKHVDLGLKMIFDDFESRTCENCKWFHEFVDNDAGYGPGWVSCDEIYMELNNFDKTTDFCSRFERKTHEI